MHNKFQQAAPMHLKYELTELFNFTIILLSPAIYSGQTSSKPPAPTRRGVTDFSMASSIDSSSYLKSKQSFRYIEVKSCPA